MNTNMKGILSVVAAALLAGCMPPCHARQEMRGMLAPSATEAQGAPLANIYFAFDRSDLSDESKSILDKNAAWLKSNSDAGVRIEGYADERGSNAYNKALGKRRALSAARYLEQQGIAAGRITTVSYGEERPLDAGHNPEAWAKNRRVEFDAMGVHSQP